VLVAIPSLRRGGDANMQGGPEGVILNLLRAFDRTRFDVHLAVDDADTSELVDLVDAPLEVHSVAARRWQRLPNGRYPVLGLAALARDLRPSVVLATLRMNATVALARPLLPRHTAVVARLANNVSGTLDSQRQVRGGLRVRAAHRLHAFVPDRATLVIAQSSSMAADLERRHGRRHVAKTRTIPNPVDTDTVRRRGAAPAHDALTTGRPHLVSVGRLHHQKGYDLLLPAFARLLDAHPAATLRILGEGPDRADLTRQLGALGIADRVDLHGFVPDPLPFVAAADLYVCSSRYEGFSNALAEAAALGVPMVAPAGPAAGEAIVHPGNGRLLVDALSTESLVDALRGALDATFDRAEIAEDCRERFGIDAVTRQYEALLDEAVSLAGGPSRG
jgi:glycosyltransferase involved in cell wall biosynthesis